MKFHIIHTHSPRSQERHASTCSPLAESIGYSCNQLGRVRNADMPAPLPLKDTITALSPATCQTLPLQGGVVGAVCCGQPVAPGRSWLTAQLEGTAALRMWLCRGPSRPSAARQVIVHSTAAGQVEAGTRPGGAPVVFAGDATKRPFSLGRWHWPSSRPGSHILHPELVAPLEQAVRVFVGIVDPGRRE